MLAAALLALTSIIAYVIDWAGFGLQAWPALGAAIALTIVAAVLRPRPIHPTAGDLVAWAGIVVVVVAMFLRMSWPSLVPPGRGPDLTHHLLLVDYIQQHGHLVHDRSLGGAMGEMAHYTPASHLLAVVGGGVFGADGLRAFFPLTVFCAALTAGFVFLIARRGGLPLPYAIVAVALLFLPAPYFFGAFTHDGFLAQTVSTLFAVATWWAIAQWHDQPGAAGASVIALFLAATFLAWPIWLGPPLLVFLAMLLREDLSPRARVQQLAIAMVPLLAVFLAHSWNRWGWMVIVRTSGAVLHPSLDSLGCRAPAPRACRRCRCRKRSTVTRHNRSADRDCVAGRHAVRDRENPGRGHAVHGVQDDLSGDLSNGDPGRTRAEVGSGDCRVKSAEWRVKSA